VGSVRWQAGISLYGGRYTDYKKVVASSANGYEVQKQPTLRFNEISLGADLRLDVAGFGLQWELLANWREFDPRLRPPAYYSVAALQPPGIDTSGAVALGLCPDYVGWGTSLLLSYRLPIRKLPPLTPYLILVYLDLDDNLRIDNMIAVVGGLNLRLHGAVVLKAEYQWGRWPNKAVTSLIPILGGDDIHRFTSQLAVAF